MYVAVSAMEFQTSVNSLKVPPTARLVDEAVVEKELVEVALVEVAAREVKFWRVEDAAVTKPPVDSTWNRSVPAELKNFKKLPVKETVEEALMRVPVVPVAFTWNKAPVSSEAVVVAPTTNDFRDEEVAERKSPLEISLKASPKVAPPAPSSEPSQRAAAPVIAVQKSDSAVPTVLKILNVPPPIAKLVVDAVVA